MRQKASRITPPDEPRPPVPAAYMPLYTYLDRRYAGTVVLTFEQIEALLGFAPPSPAFADAEWWTGSGGANDRHRAAWTAACRSAAPQLGARNRGVRASSVTAVATAADHPRPPIGPGLLRRAASTIGDLLVGLVIVLCIPFVILALGIPIALGGRFLLWIAGML